jgi:cytochrome P450
MALLASLPLSINLALALPVIYLSIRSIYRRYILYKLGASAGCKPIHCAGSVLPWGLDRKFAVLKHKPDTLLDDYTTRRYIEEGKWVYTTDSYGLDTSICAADPKFIQAVLANNFADWGMGEARRRAVGPLMGHDGVFTSDGPVWHKSRALLRPQFQKEQVSDLRSVERHVQHLFEAMESTSGDILPLIMRFNLDVTTEYLCSESVESQTLLMGRGAPGTEKQTEDAHRLEQAFADANKGAQIRVKAGPFYWLGNTKAFRNACSTWAEYGDRFLNAALAQKRAIRDGKQKSEKYLFLHDMPDDPSPENRRLMRDLIIQLLFAGEDTTASLLAFVLRSLVHHAGAWNRLREEVISTFGTESDPKADITFSSLKACVYLQNVLKETLRMYPPIPMNAREALRDTVMPVGGGVNGDEPCVISKGTVVKYSPYVMQRREDIWGADAKQWNPDRWVNKKVGWEYIPFNGGPRICIGRKLPSSLGSFKVLLTRPTEQFALTESAYVIVRIVQHFDAVKCMDPEAEISTRFSTALFPKKGVPLKFSHSKR